MRFNYITLFFCIFIIFLLGCSNYDIIPKEKIYYNQFKNPNLNYSWNFNKFLEGGGGHTYNRSYMELNDYTQKGFFSIQMIPYELTYKHEEGHIYMFNLLNIDSLEAYENEIVKGMNKVDNDTFRREYRKYTESFSDGVANYYAMSYFGFNTNSVQDYWKWVVKNRKSIGGRRYYIGFLFVNTSLNNRDYNNLSDFIEDYGSDIQYSYYKTFISGIPD